MEISIEDFLAMGDTDNNPEMAYNRGKWLKNKARYTDAIKDFSDAIRLKDDYKEAYIERSLCFYATTNYDLAINDATQAINLAKNSSDFRKGNFIANYLEVRSRYHIAKNDILNAFKDLNYSCEITFTNAFYSRGILFFKEKNYNEALRDFEQMTVFYPNDSVYHYKMGLCYLKMENKTKAIELLRKAETLGSKEATNLLCKLI